MHQLSFRGFSAWITTDGEPLNVYQEETTGTTCSAWIPSTANQVFSVWWRDDSKARIATSGHVFVDGNDVASAIMRPGRSKPVERSGAKTSSRTLKPFKFSVLKLTGMRASQLPYDEKVANQNDPAIKNIGTIKVEITRVKLGDEVPFKGYETQNHSVVHEKAKKLGGHCTSYGPTKRTSASRTVAVTTAPYDADEPGPYVTFLFRYRSEDLLRANGTITYQHKRTSPSDDDEVIVISDSDSDQEKSGTLHAKKRARLDADKSEAVGQPPQSDDASAGEGDLGSGDVEMDDSQLDLGAPSLLQENNNHEESQTQADDDSQLAFGAPSLLQKVDAEKDSENKPEDETQQAPGSPAHSQDKKPEESQTQADDDSQLAFGAPSLLQQADAKDSEEKQEDETQQAPGSPADSDDTLPESQLEVEGAMLMSEESQEV